MLPDLYAILGVSRGADDAAIREAYRRQTESLKVAGSPDDARSSAGLREAFEILTDPEQRAALDACATPRHA